MSRLEKTIQKKSKRKKFRFISKVLFILFMCSVLGVCVFIVDYNAKAMLGEGLYNKADTIKDVQNFLNEKTTDISLVVKDLISQFNK